ISNSDSQEAVEIEETRCRERVYVVVVVEGVEHLDCWLESHALRQLETLVHSPVKREILVVFAICVSIVCRTDARSNRLSRPRLNAASQLNATPDFRVGEEIEFVTNVTVGQGVVERQIVNVKRAIGKRIALIRVIV